MYILCIHVHVRTNKVILILLSFIDITCTCTLYILSLSHKGRRSIPGKTNQKCPIHDMHMALFRVWDGFIMFISAQVSERSETSAEITHLARETVPYAFSRTISDVLCAFKRFHNLIFHQSARWVYISDLVSKWGVCFGVRENCCMRTDNGRFCSWKIWWWCSKSLSIKIYRQILKSLRNVINYI